MGCTGFAWFSGFTGLGFRGILGDFGGLWGLWVGSSGATDSPRPWRIKELRGNLIRDLRGSLKVIYRCDLGIWGLCKVYNIGVYKR